MTIFVFGRFELHFWPDYLSLVQEFLWQCSDAGGLSKPEILFLTNLNKTSVPVGV